MTQNKIFVGKLENLPQSSLLGVQQGSNIRKRRGGVGWAFFYGSCYPWSTSPLLYSEPYSASKWTPGLQFAVSPKSGIFRFHDFWHSWKVPSSPNDSWTTRWVLGFCSKHQGLLVERPPVRIHFGKWPKTKYLLGNWKTSHNRHC